jgi:hypothetical protein
MILSPFFLEIAFGINLSLGWKKINKNPNTDS